MNYWKAPVTYLLKTLAALAAFFLLAWALPYEKAKVNGHIILLPALFAQPFAGLAVILFLKTVFSVFGEIYLWWILNRPLPDTPDKAPTSKRTTARRSGNTAKVVSSEAETAFARYLQKAGRTAAGEVPVRGPRCYWWPQTHSFPLVRKRSGFINPCSSLPRGRLRDSSH